MTLDLERVYRYRFEGVDDVARTEVWHEIARFVWERCGRPDAVLDPAAGSGEFIAAVPAGERWAVDRVDHGLSALRDVTVRIGAFGTVDLPSSHFDLVFVSNILEHLANPDAVAAFLGEARDALRPGGRVAVLGPNFRYCAKDYFDCADHVLALTDVSVAEHVFAAGFDVEDVVARFLPYSFRSRLPPSARLTRAYLRSPALWRLLGKQFLVIGRRT